MCVCGHSGSTEREAIHVTVFLSEELQRGSVACNNLCYNHSEWAYLRYWRMICIFPVQYTWTTWDENSEDDQTCVFLTAGILERSHVVSKGFVSYRQGVYILEILEDGLPVSDCSILEVLEVKASKEPLHMNLFWLYVYHEQRVQVHRVIDM